MTDFFILAVAVFAAICAVRLLMAGWRKSDEPADRDPSSAP
ncbi:MAG: hypothetical protein WBA25_06600 [Jannaschia sp.]